MSSTKRIKRNLKKSIKSVCKRRAEFVVDPSRDFTRHGKLPLEACIKSVLSFTSKSYNGEMVDLFACKPDMPTVSALHVNHAHSAPLARSFSTTVTEK